MMSRTHGVHAEPTTFGLKLATWYNQKQFTRGTIKWTLNRYAKQIQK